MIKPSHPWQRAEISVANANNLKKILKIYVIHTEDISKEISIKLGENEEYYVDYNFIRKGKLVIRKKFSFTHVCL